jgi:hypothetical protein
MTHTSIDIAPRGQRPLSQTEQDAATIYRHLSPGRAYSSGQLADQLGLQRHRVTRGLNLLRVVRKAVLVDDSAEMPTYARGESPSPSHRPLDRPGSWR